MKTLPKGWTEATLGQVIEGFETGRSIQAAGTPAGPNEFGVLKISAVTWGRFQPEENKALFSIDKPRPHETVKSGDLLISRANTTTLIGAPVLVERDYDHLMLPDKILRVLYKAELVDPRYLVQALRSPIARTYIEANATGTSESMRNLSQVKLKKIPILLAPLSEQKRIADKLDRLIARADVCKERLDRIPKILNYFRQAVLEAATSGDLSAEWREAKKIEDGFQSFEIDESDSFSTYQFPSSWQAVRLSDIASIQGGVTKDLKKQSHLHPEIPYLRVANVQRGFLNLKEIKSIRIPPEKLESLLLRTGDILFNEGGDIDKLGRGWVWNDELPVCTYQNHVFRARLLNPKFEPRYVSWYGNSRGHIYFLSNGKQTTNLASINKSVLSSLPVAVPPPEEQVEIVRRIESLFSLADALDAKYTIFRAQVNQLIPSLISKAFSGNFVPQNSSDEPAKELLDRTIGANQIQRPGLITTKPTRRTPLDAALGETLLDVIGKIPKDGLTFEELSNLAARDYETIKEELFKLLAMKDPAIQQFFDTKTKTMKFRQVQG
ncbi:restriction endonuclease subunit S [Pseudomonas psychrophila]|uniref:restriction endonuclease subunit S n=1 Tax=Pseudomonas psychrophila TaxID=122355 RepID=UPI0038103808